MQEDLVEVQHLKSKLYEAAVSNRIPATGTDVGVLKLLIMK